MRVQRCASQDCQLAQELENVCHIGHWVHPGKSLCNWAGWCAHCRAALWRGREEKRKGQQGSNYALRTGKVRSVLAGCLSSAGLY